jgi:plasmid stabilization system protein ParE
MRRITFIAPARREFLSEVVYYNNKEPGLGDRFTSAVEEAATRAATFPLTGSPASKSTRRVFIKNFPFAIIYRTNADGIVIFAVANHSREPEYWQPRITER